MAKKNNVEIDESKETSKTNPEQEYADNKLSEFLDEPVKDGKVVEKEEPKEVKVEEPVTETKEEVKEEPIPTFDKDELKQEVKAEVAQELIEKLQGKDKEEAEQYPWEKEGRNPTYKEALDYVKDTTKAELKAEQEALQAEQAARIEAETKTTQETRDAWNTYWNTQFDELEKTGKIPAIEDNNDPNDKGLRLRFEMFEKMKESNLERTKQGLPESFSLKEVYYEKYADTKEKQPAGADAPVAGVTRAATTSTGSDYDYKEIKNKSLYEIVSDIENSRST